MSVIRLVEALKRCDTQEITGLVADHPNLLNSPLEGGMNALHLAVSSGDLDLVRCILDCEADPNAIIEFAEISPWHSQESWLAEPEACSESIWQELQQLGCISALHIAVKAKQYAMCELLLSYNATPAITDQGGCYPLHWAVTQKNFAICQCLLQAGAPVNCGDLVDNTPLHEAVRHQSLEIARLLLDNGAKPQQQDLFGQTSLDLAGNNVAMREILLTFWQQPAEAVRH